MAQATGCLCMAPVVAALAFPLNKLNTMTFVGIRWKTDIA